MFRAFVGTLINLELSLLHQPNAGFKLQPMTFASPLYIEFSSGFQYMPGEVFRLGLFPPLEEHWLTLACRIVCLTSPTKKVTQLYYLGSFIKRSLRTSTCLVISLLKRGVNFVFVPRNYFPLNGEEIGQI